LPKAVPSPAVRLACCCSPNNDDVNDDAVEVIAVSGGGGVVGGRDFTASLAPHGVTQFGGDQQTIDIAVGVDTLVTSHRRALDLQPELVSTSSGTTIIVTVISCIFNDDVG
jgi:hypothetical protein